MQEILDRQNFVQPQQALDFVASLLQSSTEYSIIGKDLTGRILLWNEGARRLYGYEPDEVVGRANSSILHTPEDVQLGKAREIMEAALRDGRWEGTLDRVRKNGDRFTARVVITPRRDAAGSPIGFLLISKDISNEIRLTEPLQATQLSTRSLIESNIDALVTTAPLGIITDVNQQTLQEKNVELESANLAKDRFFASMGHELRTPLNAILGFTGTLLLKFPGPLTGDQDKQLRTVQASARQLLSLINDLLDLAKIESGNVQLNLEPVVCQTVLEEVATALRPLAETKGLGFDVTAPGEELVVRTDRRALSQILIKLVNNAIKFTEHGSVRLELERARRNGVMQTMIRVIDTGPGIRPEDQTNLFRAFEQLGKRGAQRHEGPGLGLHLSRKLAMLLGADIDFDSEFGKGSTFTLVISDRPKAELH